MKRRQGVKVRKRRTGSPAQSRSKGTKGRRSQPARATARTQKKAGRRGGFDLMAVADDLQSYATIAETLRLYRPRKAPITVRIDVDVLAWFKKGGRRYQTRINKALRSVMEREMKKAAR